MLKKAQGEKIRPVTVQQSQIQSFRILITTNRLLTQTLRRLNMVQSLFLSPLLWTPTSLIGALMLLRRIKNSKLQSILRRGPKSKHRCRATRTSSDLTLGKTRVYLLLFQKVRSWLLETIRMTCLKQSILIKTFKAKINL